MSDLTLTAECWLNPERKECYETVAEAKFYSFRKSPRRRRAFVTTEGVSRAVFNAAYQHGLTPTQIKHIWHTAGDNFRKAWSRVSLLHYSRASACKTSLAMAIA